MLLKEAELFQQTLWLGLWGGAKEILKVEAVINNIQQQSM
jgi:hypothetical protein